MDDDQITITYGDEVALQADPVDRESGELAIRIQNGAFVEPARWLRVDMAPGSDRTRAINQLIYSLEQLRDRVS
ncbi:hypothetical protein ACR5MH_1035 (plasmid) [Streptomyces sp. L7]|uniref:hypothetical protein n=1 Tax=Streptomyces sp. L7 TaxID=3423954 RepID=UPI00389AB0E6